MFSRRGIRMPERIVNHDRYRRDSKTAPRDASRWSRVNYEIHQHSLLIRNELSTNHRLSSTFLRSF